MENFRNQEISWPAYFYKIPYTTFNNCACLVMMIGLLQLMEIAYYTFVRSKSLLLSPDNVQSVYDLNSRPHNTSYACSRML